MKEFEVYNWGKSFYNQLKNHLTKKFKKFKKSFDPKISGYRSIHYLVKKEDFYIEIQLRTLFQDVWAELKHELVYKKGNVNEHIKRSFILLAKDLENNDSLVQICVSVWLTFWFIFRFISRPGCRYSIHI